MLRLLGVARIFLRQIQIIVPLFAAITLLAVSSLPAAAQVIATYDFEDGTAQNWTSFNGASTPASTTAAAYSGSHSLLTTTGSSGQGGPSINLGSVLQAGAKYTITGYVRLTSGETATNANFTIRRSDASCSGGTCYDTIGAYQTAVNDSGWVAIGGSYTVTTTETGLSLYAQLVGATTAQSFYLDDAVITQTAPPPGGTTVAQYTWSDGGLDGWFPFGSPTLTNAMPAVADPAGNANALLTSNRTAGYMGPALNLLNLNLSAGATYQVTAYVLLAAADSANPTVTLSTKSADCATAGAYANLATSGALSSTTWTKVQGTFSFSNLPGPPTSLTLYAQSSSATDSFYISGVTISQIAPPPPDPSQQDNSGISTTFEDGGLDGWSSRSGQSTVTNVSGVAHTGSNSLLTTGRIANWDGPQISISNKMYPGSVYNVSGWVMLQPTDGTNHTINVSLQTTLNGNTSYPGVSGYPGITVPADGAWHQISVMGYNMSSPYDQGAASLYFQTVPSSGNDLVSFYIDDFQLSYVNPPQIQKDIPSIYQTLSQFFPVGAAIDMTDISGPHAQLLTMHFNSITSGNDMKWSSVEGTKGSFNYGNADAQVGLAQCAGMRVRGHNLVWANGSQTPSYATGDGTNSPANQALVTANIQEHIQNEVQHFGNKVYAWDVVNEPLDPNQPDCLVHGPFYKVLGASYLDVALQAARQYAPAGTKLFINDYSTTDPNRLACLVKVAADLKSKGLLDGVGHEMHNAINYPSVPAIVNAIETVANQVPDIDQQVTELDMSVYNAGDTKADYGNNVPPAILAEQGWLYKAYFDAFKQLSTKLSAVTIWGMADDDTWLDSFPVTRTDYPLQFDKALQAKPAYWGIVDPTKLPGYGMTFALSTKASTSNTRVLTITATNGNAGTAYATTLTGFTLTQISGPACTPKVTSGGTPNVLGDIAPNAAASASFTVNITGCNPLSQFKLSVPWSSAVYDTGTFVTNLDFNRGR
jgi:endo-1,4-beta-xylanase